MVLKQMKMIVRFSFLHEFWFRLTSLKGYSAEGVLLSIFLFSYFPFSSFFPHFFHRQGG